MGTGIDYVDDTINYITGCTKVSPACKNCYAEIMTKRLKAMGQKKYQAGFEKVVEHWKMLYFKFPKKPRRYFVNSMSDTFHERVSFNFQYEMFKRFYLNPQHTFLLFTKRAENLWRRMIDINFHLDRNYTDFNQFLNNVWIIVTTENQEMFDQRMRYLSMVKAKVKGVSIEPMLGHINLSKYINRLDWVIVGGETGHNARPMHPEWVDSIRDQCQAANIPYWFKQWGTWQNGSYFEDDSKSKIVLNNGIVLSSVEDRKAYSIDESNWYSYSPTMMAKVGKKKAGDLLDDKQYKEMPL